MLWRLVFTGSFLCSPFRFSRSQSPRAVGSLSAAAARLSLIAVCSAPDSRKSRTCFIKTLASYLGGINEGLSYVNFTAWLLKDTTFAVGQVHQAGNCGETHVVFETSVSSPWELRAQDKV